MPPGAQPRPGRGSGEWPGLPGAWQVNQEHPAWVAGAGPGEGSVWILSRGWSGSGGSRTPLQGWRVAVSHTGTLSHPRCHRWAIGSHCSDSRLTRSDLLLTSVPVLGTSPGHGDASPGKGSPSCWGQQELLWSVAITPARLVAPKPPPAQHQVIGRPLPPGVTAGMRHQRSPAPLSLGSRSPSALPSQGPASVPKVPTAPGG